MKRKYGSRIFNLAVRVRVQLHAPVPFCPLLYWVHSVFVLRVGTLLSNNSKDHAYFYARSCPCGVSIKITVFPSSNNPRTTERILMKLNIREIFDILYSHLLKTRQK
jgi:hypothetical protein